MSREELLEKLKSLPPPELREVLGQVGFVPSSDLSTGQPIATTGLTPGLLRGLVTDMAADFDDELPDSFWSGDEDEP
jgi:hypothetical protein